MRRKDETMRQSALRLPTDLYEKLRAIGGERGMGEEIRRRLEASFEPQKVPDDPATAKLLEAISSVASTVSIDAPWSEDAYAFKILKAAVDTLLMEFQPEGNAAPAHRRLFGGPDDPAETVGRTMANTTLLAMGLKTKGEPS
jgi:hypothetical protein